MHARARCLAALLLLTLAAFAPSGFAQYTYTTLLNPFTSGGASTGATGINADGVIVGGYAVYNEYNGDGSLGFTLQDGNWQSYTFDHATLNRTTISGIVGDTLYGSYASGEPEHNKDPNLWFSASGFVGYDEINDPGVNVNDTEQGTYVTGYDGTTIVGLWTGANNIQTGFSLLNGTYTDLQFFPNAVQGSRIVGSGFNGELPSGVVYENGITTFYDVPSSWGLAATSFTAISGDLLTGTYTNADHVSLPFLYNIATDTWTQLNLPDGALST